MHELGYAAGLDDLGTGYEAYLMNDNRIPAPTPLAVPQLDLYYMREAHRNPDHGSSPH